MRTATASCVHPGGYGDPDLVVTLTELPTGTGLTILNCELHRSAPFDDVLAEYRRAGWAVEA